MDISTKSFFINFHRLDLNEAPEFLVLALDLKNKRVFESRVGAIIEPREGGYEAEFEAEAEAKLDYLSYANDLQRRGFVEVNDKEFHTICDLYY